MEISISFCERYVINDEFIIIFAKKRDYAIYRINFVDFIDLGY